MLLNKTQQQALELIRQAEILNANIWSHPKGARGGRSNLDNVCEYCGKHLKDDKRKYVSILISGLLIPSSIEENVIWQLSEKGLCDEPQGAFAIGSNCAKKLLGKELINYIFY